TWLCKVIASFSRACSSSRFGMTCTTVRRDLSILLDREALDAQTLASAIAATFIRRGSVVPDPLPVGLTDEFANDPSRQALWHAFLKKNDMTFHPLSYVPAFVSSKLEPAIF